jgi:hypothetical protein
MIRELTCEQVEDQLDLYAVKECDLPTRVAIDAHVSGCPACAASLEASRQLLGLLDLRAAAPARLERLRSAIDAEAAPPAVLPFRPRRQARVLRVAHRFGALAAGLLVCLGLIGVAGPLGSTGGDPTTEVVEAALLSGPALEEKAIKDGRPAHALEAMSGQKSKAEREARFELRAVREASPPAVELRLQARNPTNRPVTLWLAGPRTSVELDLSGPGVERRPAPASVRPDVSPERLTLAPGATDTVTIRQLIAGRKGAAEYVTWTQPGTYTLKARLQVQTPTGETVILAAPPARARIEAER